MKNKVLPLATLTTLDTKQYKFTCQVTDNSSTKLKKKQVRSPLTTFTHHHLLNAYKQGSLSVTGFDNPYWINFMLNNTKMSMVYKHTDKLYTYPL